MKEKIFNIYVVINGNIVESIKAVSYEKDGNDKEKTDFLIRRVEQDFGKAKKYPLSFKNIKVVTGINQGTINKNFYGGLIETGQNTRLFENAFRDLGAPNNPLMVVTNIIDGKIMNDFCTDMKDLQTIDLSNFPNLKNLIFVDE